MVKISSSKILFFLCLSFIAGVIVESFIKIPQIFIWGFFVLGIIIIFFVIKKQKYLHFIFCLLFFVLGILRMQISEFNVANDKLAKLNDKPNNITLQGVVVGGADVRDNSQKLKVKVYDSIILISADKYPEYHYLDKIKFTGKLKTPMVAEDFNYKNYLMKDGIYSVMNFPKIELVGKQKANIFEKIYSGILWVKEKLRDSIYQNFLPPERMILEGIILGNNKTMTQDLRDKLSRTGLRYLTAISGVHVIILSNIIFTFLMFFPFLKRQQALFLSVFLVWFYVALTGFTASGIRAAIMGSIFLLAQVFGKQNTSYKTITLAAAFMLLQNPMLLLYDVGFQLSYLASLGIIYIKPVFDILVKLNKVTWLAKFLDMVSVTLSAQIATLPIMVFNFGNIPLVGPITSILILPVMPLILIFGFLAGFAGIFWQALSNIFALPCQMLLLYFIKILDIFSEPWMSKTINNVSWIWLAGYYLIIIFIVIFFRKKTAAF